MCGIVGGTEPGWPYESAVAAIRHRGPDGQRVVRREGATLGFARLRIIDLRELADQPMASEDGRVWIVFNGEIYGFRALRAQLEREGLRFRSESDTEVALAAYLHWGEDFIDHLDGMFALAILDERDATLRLYRDRPGIKPLYYHWDGRRFAFASELKAIRELCGTGLEIDATAAYDFLTYGYVPAPKSFYRNVFKLPPASRLRLDLASMHLSGPERYWELPVEAAPIGPADAEERLRELLDVSVEEQLVADVPVGVFLSGGMDSSAVVASASAASSGVRTFSIGFEDADHDETAPARRVAEHFGTEHHEKVFPRDAMPELLPKLAEWYDEPFADTSAFPTWCVSGFARERVTVALSGDGGDELFGGYRWYERHARLARRPRPDAGPIRALGASLDAWKARWPRESLPWKALNFAGRAAADELSLHARLLGGMPRGEKRRHARALEVPSDYDDLWHFRRHWRPELPVRTRLQVLDFHTWLPDDILTKVDRVSMAHSLEVRVPLLSRRLVEFAFSVPEAIRYAGGVPKGLMRRAYRDRLPPGIAERDKRGFSVPPIYRPDPSRHRCEVILADVFGISP